VYEDVDATATQSAAASTAEVSTEDEMITVPTSATIATEKENPTAKSEEEKQALANAIFDFKLTVDSMFCE